MSRQTNKAGVVQPKWLQNELVCDGIQRGLGDAREHFAENNKAKVAVYTGAGFERWGLCPILDDAPGACPDSRVGWFVSVEHTCDGIGAN